MVNNDHRSGSSGDWMRRGLGNAARGLLLEIALQPGRVAVHGELDDLAPAQPKDVHALVAGGNAVDGEAIGPRDHGDGIPRPAVDGDVANLEAEVRKEARQALVPPSRCLEVRALAPQGVVAEEDVPVRPRELGDDAIVASGVDVSEGAPELVLHDRVVHADLEAGPRPQDAAAVTEPAGAAEPAPTT